MNERVCFNSEDVRVDFFEEVKKHGGFNTWVELGAYCNKRRNVIGYYRSGELTLPAFIFDKLSRLLPCELDAIYRSRISYKDKNWGAKLGGLTTYYRHKEIFDRGRAISIKNTKRRLKYAFDANMPLSDELGEFLGCFIGDGFTNRYGRMHQIQFAGDNRLDLEYYNRTIIPIALKLFNLKSAYTRIKDNALWVNFYSKNLFRFLTERFNMPAGVKFDKVLIPNEILKADANILIACIRGIFDTDGGVYFDKRKIYKEPYIRIELHMHNKRIIEQIRQCLQKLDINVKMLSHGTRLQILGKNSVKQFLERIGFSNDKHRNRIAEFFPGLEKITNKLETN